MFAVSLDTLGQAALLAVAAASFGGVLHAVALVAVFVLGMLLVDALNGWGTACLMSRADRLAARASRIMAFAVAAFSLLVATLGAARLLAHSVGPWQTDERWLFGIAGVAAAAMAGVALMARSGRPRAPTAG